MLAVVAKTKVSTKSFGYESATDQVQAGTVAARLSAEGLSRHIHVFDVSVSQQKQLTFHFEFEDHDYIIAEDNTKYRELSAFGGPQATALWVKLFMAISEVSGVPLTSIDGREGLDPQCGLHVAMTKGTVEQTGEPCVEDKRLAAFPTRVEIPIYRAKAEVASASTVPLQGAYSHSVYSLALVSEISKEFFKKYDVEPTIREQSAGYFVIGAYALRNAVLVGENRWEQVSFYIGNVSGSEFGILTLFVVSDGYYTGGMGGPPPTASYTTPFEPQYYKQLEEFSNRFGEYIRERMSRR
jgi:hypothetical protein